MTNINKKNVLISFISIIGCIVSIGAISILTIFQANAQNDDDIPNMQKQINFSGINNNAGVLKSLTFTKSGNQSEAINSFYMNYNNVILNYPNIITNGGNISENGIIIGGKENKTDSINTPIIGGSNIKTSGDSTSFGGEHNTIEGRGTSIGGSYNTIIGDNTIIGGENNNVEGKNNIILGGENNNISGNNIIAAGEQIKVNNNASNSFIFSNDSSNLFEFTPEAGNTFYINSVGGLGFNGDGTEKSTVIHGGVLIGEIDLTQGCTESNDIGIMGTANSCLLACTEFSLNNGWSLLENSERCINWCRNEPNCIEPPVIPDIEPEDYSAYCTGTVFSGATPCFNNFHPEIYNNVVFTNNYVNECPNNQNELDNPCTYKCPAGYSFGDGTCKKNCVKTGSNGEEIIIRHGESIDLYLANNPYCGDVCRKDTRTCNDGNLSQANANYHYLSCQIQIHTGNQCNDEEYNIEENEKIPGGKYEACTGYTINGNSCIRHVKYKLQACNPGYTLSGGTCHKDCKFNGISVPYGKTITGYKYQNSNCKDQHLCSISKILKCSEGGSFSPNPQEYPYTGCKLIGENCTGFSLTGCPNHGICSSCTGYTLNGNSCNQFIKYKLDSCNTGYSMTGNTCKADCQLPRGGSIKHGRYVIGYKNNQQTCPSKCGDVSKTMQCNDGKLEGSGTYIYSGCTTNILSGEGFNRLTKVDNAICESFTGYTLNGNSCITGTIKYKCTSCQTGYTRNGQNWSSNSVKCLKNCSFTGLPNHETVHLNGNGGTITTYSTGYFVCPNSAHNNSQTRTCNNGLLNGSFEYTHYIQTGASCTITNTPEIKTITTQLIESSNNLTMIQSCWGSAFNGSSCSENTTYYTYKCNSGYTWANDLSKCIRCEGNIPQNAHKNNSISPNGNNSINYTYNTVTSEICTYSCDEGFSRNGSQCVSDDKKCYLGRTGYIEGSFINIYENEHPTCNNICRLTRVQCKNSARRDYENYRQITGENYSGGCSTLSSSILNGNPTSQPCIEFMSNNSTHKFFSGKNNDVPDSIPNAYSVSVCLEYKSNGTGCSTPIKYRKFYCPNGRSGDTCLPSKCERRNQRFENSETLTLFDRIGDIQCPDHGNSQTITCKNGVRYSGSVKKDFNDGFIYSSNEYHLKPEECTDYPFTESTKNQIPSGSTIGTCTVYGVNGNKCTGPHTTKYKELECAEGYSKIDGICRQDCTLTGLNGNIIRIHYGQSTTGYLSGFASCIRSESCSPKTITCGSGGKFDNPSYGYGRCYVVGPTCPQDYVYDNIGDIPAGSTIETCTGYIKNDNGCATYNRYKPGIDCQTGYTKINNECKQDCQLPRGGSIPFGSGVWTYIPAECPNACTRQRRECKENGILAGSGSNNCTHQEKICSIDFNLDSCPTHGLCETCTGYNNHCYITNTKYKITSCIEPRVLEGGVCKNPCTLPRGGFIKHNTSIGARKFENGECKYATRVCDNGNLSNPGYNSKECTTCKTPRNTRVSSGQTVTAYKETKCTSPNSSCSHETRTCKNGERYNGTTKKDFSADFKEETCIIEDGETSGCSDDHNITENDKQPGGIYQAGCTRYHYNGSTCEGKPYYKLIRCDTNNNYTQEGNICHTGCNVWGNNYKHGETVTGYISPKMCQSTTTECDYETRTCLDGNRYVGGNIKNDFSGLSKSCTKTAYTCPNFPLTGEPSDPINCSYQECTTYEGNSCTPTGKKYALVGINNSEYYATGATCSKICGNGFGTLCNGPYYTAIGATRGNGYTTWGHGYLCIKNDTSVEGVDIQQCSCGNKFRNGEQCQDSTHNVCGDEVNQCLEGVLVESEEGHNRGYKWICQKQGEAPDICYKCKTEEGYDTWNDRTESCEKGGCQAGKACGGTRPKGEGVLIYNDTIICDDEYDEVFGYVYGYTGWTYEDNYAEAFCCSWTCDEGYFRNSAGTGCLQEPKCGVFQKSERPSDNELCPNSTTQNYQVIEYCGGLFPYHTRECKTDSFVKSCTQPYPVVFIGPVINGQYIISDSSSYLSAIKGMKYFINVTIESNGTTSQFNHRPKTAGTDLDIRNEFNYGINFTSSTRVTKVEVNEVPDHYGIWTINPGGITSCNQR